MSLDRSSTPNISAQIIAKAWSDSNFAQALQGPNAHAAIQDAFGVSLPAGAPVPEIPPAPSSQDIQTGVRAGVVFTVAHVRKAMATVHKDLLITADKIDRLEGMFENLIVGTR